jgi:histidinol-phosphate aminotransferase
VQLLDKVRTPFNINQAAQAAALAAWNDPGHMQRCVHATVAQREVMAGRLRSMGVRMAESATNFLFLDVARPNGPVAEALLARGIIVKPWKEVGYEHFIRVSVGTPQDNGLFLAALEDVLA